MKLHKAYIKGFSKVAADVGLDPNSLVKMAEPGILDSIVQTYRDLDPDARRAVLGGLLTGVGTYALSDGGVGRRLLHGAVGGALGGAATYGLGRMGVLDGIFPRRRKLLGFQYA